MTNTWDAANRLINSQNSTNSLTPIYNGVNDRVGQIVDGVQTDFALDVQGLPEVIYTSDDEAYLHLPGVIVTENSAGERRYLLSDGLGSVRQAMNEAGAVVAYYEFDPYGNPVNNTGGDPYGYTGEWYGGYTHLLHLRARWYAPESGTFLSVDPVESEPPYQYVRGNVVNFTDSAGLCAEFGDDACWGIYEQINQLCPECSQMTRPTITGDRLLYEENAHYLRMVLERVKSGWRPLPQLPPSSSGINRKRYLFAFEIINVPCGVKLNPGGLGFKDDTTSNALGVIGAGIDAYELITIFKPNYSQVPAAVDVVFGFLGSVAAGETYLGESPHPELPNGIILGQDFWVAAIDLGGASAANATLPKLGALVGATVGNADGPVPISEGMGYLAGTLLARDIDVGLTEFGLYNDLSRTPFNVEHQLVPPVPTWYGAGMMWEEIPFFVWLRYECPPTYCE